MEASVHKTSQVMAHIVEASSRPLFFFSSTSFFFEEKKGKIQLIQVVVFFGV